jgi:hypothetical protein
VTKDRKYPCPPDKAAAIDEAIKKFNGSNYTEMQTYVRQKYGFQPRSSWIGDRKEHLGYGVRA